MQYEGQEILHRRWCDMLFDNETRLTKTIVLIGSLSYEATC